MGIEKVSAEIVINLGDFSRKYPSIYDGILERQQLATRVFLNNNFAYGRLKGTVFYCFFSARPRPPETED